MVNTMAKWYGRNSPHNPMKLVVMRLSLFYGWAVTHRHFVAVMAASAKSPFMGPTICCVNFHRFVWRFRAITTSLSNELMFYFTTKSGTASSYKIPSYRTLNKRARGRWKNRNKLAQVKLLSKTESEVSHVEFSPSSVV
jgi:hypothetical protein